MPAAPNHRPALLTALLLSALLAGSAVAEELRVLEVEPAKERLECPKEKPTLIVKAPRDGTLSLDLKRQGQEEVLHHFDAPLKAGTPLRKSWPQTDGEATYLAHVKIAYADGSDFEGMMGFTFYCAPPIDVSLAKAGLDLIRGRLKLVVKGPAVRAQVRVDGDGDTVLVEKTIKLRGGRRAKPLTVKWPVDEEAGFGGLDLKVFDKHGAWVQLKLTPFSLEIPHDEVEFASGKWTIPPEEEHKLEATLETIRAELEQFVADLSQPALYITGHTDTVGSRGDNRRLSANRARSIGKWFRAHGLTHDIYTRGFGEEVPAIETPDSTDEPGNRRAVYILTNFPPPAQPGVPRVPFKRLR